MAATANTPPKADARPLGAPSCADTPRVAPADMPGAFAYEHTDIPEDMTLAEWRRQRRHRHGRRHRHWLRHHGEHDTA